MSAPGKSDTDPRYSDDRLQALADAIVLAWRQLDLNSRPPLSVAASQQEIPGIERVPDGEPLDFVKTIDRLRTIVAETGDALLTEGPVQPDHKLLELCAEALHYRRRAAELKEARDALPAPYGNPPATPEQNRLREELRAENDAADNRAMHLSRRVAKLRARTAPAVYAKALVVRSSKTGAAVLAMSLAEDLIGCEVLRLSLWPVESQP